MAFFSGIFNFGIGTGALLGGQVVNTLGIANVFYAGGALGVVSILLCLIVAVHRLKSIPLNNLPPRLLPWVRFIDCPFCGAYSLVCAFPCLHIPSIARIRQLKPVVLREIVGIASTRLYFACVSEMSRECDETRFECRNRLCCSAKGRL